MLLVGLTGNYGMGKSSVLSAFRDLGAITIDSDAVVAGLLTRKEIVREVAAIFGEDVIDRDGLLDKKIIADKIFNNSKLRTRLEAILHPLVMDEIDRFVLRYIKKRVIMVVEVPLLFEGRYQGRFHKTITVFTAQKTALDRLIHAGISRKDALARLKAQMPIREKKRLADYTINNNGTRKETLRQIREIYASLLSE